MTEHANHLDRDEFLTVVKNAPLVSIDLVIYNPDGKVLLGERTNEPARGTWFVPGGRICKDERLTDAFARISRAEVGVELKMADAKLLGVYEHLYDTNFATRPGVSTHYIVLGYEVRLPAPLKNLPDAQHSHYRWSSPAEILTAPDVHANTKAYFATS